MFRMHTMPINEYDMICNAMNAIQLQIHCMYTTLYVRCTHEDCTKMAERCFLMENDSLYSIICIIFRLIWKCLNLTRRTLLKEPVNPKHIQLWSKEIRVHVICDYLDIAIAIFYIIFQIVEKKHKYCAETFSKINEAVRFCKPNFSMILKRKKLMRSYRYIGFN